MVIAYSFSDGFGVHGFGARYYSEVFFCLFALSARGIIVLAGVAKSLRLGDEAIRWSHATVAFVVAGLLVSGAVSLPTRLSYFRNYNGVENHFAKAMAKNKIAQAIVLLPPERGWYAWGDVARYLPATEKGDLLFAETFGDSRAVRAAYPQRRCYY